MSKRPSFQFYPSDWLQDLAVRACSLAARGLWIDMLCFMHQGSPYGHLTLPTPLKHRGEESSQDTCKPILPQVLARMVGVDVAQLNPLLDELENVGAFSRTADGMIFSRRMVRDEKVRESRANGGIESLKHPNVPRPKDRGKDTFKGSLRESSSGSPSSSSSSSKEKGSAPCNSSADGFNSTDVAQITCQQNGWSGYRIVWTLKDAIDFQSKQMAESSPDQVAEWLVSAYRDYKAAQQKFAVGPEKFFAEGRYQTSSALAGTSKNALFTDNPATRTLAQMEGD